MGYTKAQLLAYLKELQVEFVSYDHPVVLTVEAQEKHVGHLGAGLTKSLLLKDKKHRYYVVCALASTTIDLKVLSQRLGLGKGGLRMAPEETLQELLQVPLGCVTPFALINESARDVTLMLDKGFKQQEKCLFHPLSNDTTISVGPSGLDTFLAAIGRKATYVDLEATPLVGKDNPPDLVEFVPSGVTALLDTVEEAAPAQVSVAHSSTEKFVKTVETFTEADPIQPNGRKLNSSTNSKHPINPLAEAADVGNFVKEIIEKTSAVVLSEITKNLNAKDVDISVLDVVRRRVTSDLESRAMILLNASYTEGYHSGVQSVINSACRGSSGAPFLNGKKSGLNL